MTTRKTTDKSPVIERIYSNMKMLTNKEIKEIAIRQSAEDIGCKAEDFLSEKNIICKFCLGEKARRYYKEPITCNFVSYGNNVVAATMGEVEDLV